MRCARCTNEIPTGNQCCPSCGLKLKLGQKNRPQQQQYIPSSDDASSSTTEIKHEPKSRFNQGIKIASIICFILSPTMVGIYIAVTKATEYNYELNRAVNKFGRVLGPAAVIFLIAGFLLGFLFFSLEENRKGTIILAVIVACIVGFLLSAIALFMLLMTGLQT